MEYTGQSFQRYSLRFCNHIPILSWASWPVIIYRRPCVFFTEWSLECSKSHLSYHGYGIKCHGRAHTITFDRHQLPIFARMFSFWILETGKFCKCLCFYHKTCWIFRKYPCKLQTRHFMRVRIHARIPHTYLEHRIKQTTVNSMLFQHKVQPYSPKF